MYNDNNNGSYKVGINWKDLIIKIIMFVLFILLLIHLFPKTDLSVFYDSVYSNNVKAMRDAARNYYTVDRLPVNVGDKSSMTLKEMFDNNYLIRFTDKNGDTCDERTSKVEVTKLSDKEYSLKVQLTCKDKNDFIMETIGCTSVCTNGTCTTIIDNGNNSNIGSIIDNNHNNNNNENNNGTNTKPSDSNISSGKDDDLKVTYTLYQHRKPITSTKVTYTCPSGYTLNGKKCTKVNDGATIDATPSYGADQVITTDAKINSTGNYTVYADYIKTEIGTEYTCPSGYTKNGAYCIKYTDAKVGEEQRTCPSGYTLDGTKCVKKYTASYSSGDTTYSCNKGDTLSGTTCTSSVSASESINYTCPSGYTKNGSSCYKVYTADASNSYGTWVNQGTKYYTTAQAAYTNDTSKLEYSGAITGAQCGAPCGNKGIWYKYTYYTRSISTSYSCPNGGVLTGTNTCTITKSASSSTSYTCPSGYTKNGSSCYKVYTANKSTSDGKYYCSTGDTLSGTTCTTTVNPTITVEENVCPTGYVYNNTSKKCEYTISATANKKYSYTCPTGYTKTGEGENTICSLVKEGTKTYYCEDADATLEGTKCIKTVKGSINGYTCPTGYTLNGTKCTKKNVVTIDATENKKTTVSYKYKWSQSSSIDGWEFTGKTKTETKNYTAGQQ